MGKAASSSMASIIMQQNASGKETVGGLFCKGLCCLGLRVGEKSR